MRQPLHKLDNTLIGFCITSLSKSGSCIIIMYYVDMRNAEKTWAYDRTLQYFLTYHVPF